MPTTLIIVAAVAILIILLATASYKVCPADRVMVITGPGGRRFVSGGSAFIIPFIMRVDWLSLGAVQSLLRTDTPIPTKDAILIDVNAVANFQIASETMTVDENGKQVKALENAAKNYLNQSKERMEKDVTQVLLGKLREVIGRTELKALMENRDTFAATVAESARVDMERLGLQLTTFNIQDFTDRQNVIANMGAEMAAEISRNAKLASINAEQAVAVRQNQLDLKRAELQSISDKAQAEADAVKGITAAEQSKTLKVKEQEAEIAAAEKKAVLEQKNAEIEEQKLNATIRKKPAPKAYKPATRKTNKTAPPTPTPANPYAPVEYDCNGKWRQLLTGIAVIGILVAAIALLVGAKTCWRFIAIGALTAFAMLPLYGWFDELERDMAVKAVEKDYGIRVLQTNGGNGLAEVHYMFQQNPTVEAGMVSYGHGLAWLRSAGGKKIVGRRQQVEK